MAHFFRYKVEYLNLDNEIEEDSGFTYGDSYKDAMERIETSYACDLTAVKLLYEMDASNVLFDDEIKENM